jgi:hypothetical protein
MRGVREEVEEEGKSKFMPTWSGNGSAKTKASSLINALSLSQ